MQKLHSHVFFSISYVQKSAIRFRELVYIFESEVIKSCLLKLFMLNYCNFLSRIKMHKIISRQKTIAALDHFHTFRNKCVPLKLVPVTEPSLNILQSRRSMYHAIDSYISFSVETHTKAIIVQHVTPVLVVKTMFQQRTTGMHQGERMIR